MLKVGLYEKDAEQETGVWDHFKVDSFNRVIVDCLCIFKLFVDVKTDIF